MVSNLWLIPSTDDSEFTNSLIMTSARVVDMSVTINSPSQYTSTTHDMIPVSKPFTMVLAKAYSSDCLSITS